MRDRPDMPDPDRKRWWALVAFVAVVSLVALLALDAVVQIAFGK